jgi:hypothetical protein
VGETKLDDLSREDLLKLVVAQAEEIAELRKELEKVKRKKARSATPFSKGKGKKAPKKPGRKRGKGDFTNRKEPEIKPTDDVEDHQVPLESGAKEGACPQCGSDQFRIKIDLATTIDISEELSRRIDRYHVEVGECPVCGYRERGQHRDMAADQWGATAHRVGPRVRALGLVLHYHYGVTMRKVPAILSEAHGIDLSQSALTQEALKLGTGSGAVSREADRIKEIIQQAEYVHTDDTGWKTGGKLSYLMGFVCRIDRKPAAVYYQIRAHHGAREVAEVIIDVLKRVLHTDRFKSYDAKQFDDIEKQKCLSHILKNLSEVLEKKRGPSRCFCEGLKALLRDCLELWQDHEAGKMPLSEYEKSGEVLMEDLEHYLRPRQLKDVDNQRMLNELGRHFGEGSLTKFLEDPEVEPTNNLAERILRPAVIARKVSQCSKNEMGANAYAAFKSVLGTFALQKVGSLSKAVANLLSPTRPHA